MSDNKYIKNTVNEYAQNIMGKNDLIKLNNVINITMLKLSQKPYFNDRYNMFRLASYSSNQLIISTLNVNSADMCDNGIIKENINFSDIKVNELMSNERLKIVLKDKDINNIKILTNTLKNNKELREYQEKIKEIDTKNPEFVYQLSQLKEIFKNTQIPNLITVSLSGLEKTLTNKRLREKYILNPIDKESPSDFRFFIRVNIGFLAMKCLSFPINKIDKILQSEKSSELFKSHNNSIVFKNPNVSFNEQYQKFIELEKIGHPILKKTPYFIFKNHKDEKEREYHLINEFFYKTNKESLIAVLELYLKNFISEEMFFEKYKKETNEIISYIEKQYPGFNKKAEEHNLYDEINIINDIGPRLLNKHQELLDSLSNNDKQSKNLNKLLPQKWLFTENWNINESLKGMYYMSDSNLLNGNQKNKIIISIKNDIESIGYLSFALYPVNNVLRLNMVVIGKEHWQNPKLIKAINESIKKMTKKLNSKIILMNSFLIKNTELDKFSKHQVKELFEIDGLYFVGDKESLFTNKLKDNPFKEVLYDILNDDPISIPNTEKMVNKLKELEKENTIKQKNKNFKKHIEETKTIKTKILSEIMKIKKEKKVNNVKRI